MNFFLLNHFIALLLVGLVSISIGILVLIKSQRNKTNTAFSAWALTLGSWATLLSFSIISKDYETSVFLAKAMWVFVLFIPVTTCHFVSLFLDIKKNRWFIFSGYLFALFFALITFTPYMELELRPIGYLNYWVHFGNLYYFLHLPLFLAYTLYQMYLLFKAYIKTGGIWHNQIAYVFWASLLSYIGGTSNNLLVFDIYIPYFHPFIFYLLLAVPILTAMGILKLRLMDINLAVRKATLYTISVSLISGIIVSISLLSNFFAKNISESFFYITPIIAGILSLVVGLIFWNKTKEIDKLKYEFITVVTHKLRTPLTEIRWLAEVMQNEDIDEKTRARIIKQIINADTKLIDLVSELILISNEDKISYTYKLETTDLIKITENTLKDFDIRIKKKNIDLIFEKNFKQINVNVDPTRLISVIQSILENAIAYTKDKIEVTFKEDDGYIILSIKDNGIGINKKDQPLIFSKFYRTKSALTKETEGFGISLFLAKRIIERFGGRIDVKSEGENQGSEFWIKLKTIED